MSESYRSAREGRADARVRVNPDSAFVGMTTAGPEGEWTLTLDVCGRTPAAAARRLRDLATQLHWPDERAIQLAEKLATEAP